MLFLFLFTEGIIWSMPAKKWSQPEHSTPPHKGKEKKSKLSDDISEAEDEEELYCDWCTEKVEDLVQCERCDMWLCANYDYDYD